MIEAIKLIRDQLPTRVSANWQYMSRPVVLDYAMTGTARFATQLNTGIGTIRSTTTAKAVERIGSNATTIVVSTLVPGMIPGCLIDIESTEIATVTEVTREILSTGAEQWRLALDEGTVAPHAVGTSVTLIAFPVWVRRPVEVGSTSLVVDSPYAIMPGDSFFTVSRPALIAIASPKTDILEAQCIVQVDASKWRWEIETEANSMPIAADTMMYVTASVGYRSPKIPLPDLSGPYVVDIFGAKTLGTTKEDVTVQVDFFGAENMTSITKVNEVVVSVPVRAGDLSLWDFERGTAKVVSLDEIDVKLDSNGTAGFAVDLPMKADVRLELNFKGASKVWVVGDDAVVAEQTSDGLFKCNGNFRTVKVCIVGVSNDVVKVTTNPLRLNYRSARYAYSSKLNTGEAWEGGSMSLKPLMRQLRDLVSTNDSNTAINLNDGGILL